MKKIIAFTCIALLLVVGSSCNKDKTCYGKVTVLDAAGAGVPNAQVHLAAPPSMKGDVTYDAVTNSSGVASFEVKLPAIFDITATSSAYPGLTGTGTLRVDEPGKTGESTVVMQ
jgi:hypothetical protein